MKKKPNYKLRRTIAKISVVVVILTVIVIINFNSIMRIPIYLEYSDYKDYVSAFFDSGYSNEETREIMNELKKNDIFKKLDDDYIKALHNKGYKNKTINFILTHFTKLEITKMLNKEYNKDLEEYLDIPLFNYEHYERYLEYQSDYKDLSLEQVVTRVELDLDKRAYDTPVEETDPNSLTALVNKHRFINKDYVPNDLVEMSDEYANNLFGVKEIRKETYEQFKKMADAARKEGIQFLAESGYRDYEYQDTIYLEYVNEYGEIRANEFAARAGHSEHQLGTTLDISNIYTIEEGDPEYKWIDENGYKYGFIFRYKTKFEDITGYKAEGWHIRYVGVDVATDIHKKGISFDEYWLKYIKNSSK